jgi:nucleotide-binding universal stress UspA family protein
MYTRIIVPLDGSTLAEKALPYALSIASSSGAKLLLLRVSDFVPPVGNMPYHDVAIVTEAKIYLEEVRDIISDPARPLRLAPNRIDILAVPGRPDEEIAEVALKTPSIVVMSTHGRTGLSRLVSGSVASGLLQQGQLPVLLVRPEHIEDKRPLEEILASPVSASFNRPGFPLVVALDGSPGSEAVLEPAINLAQVLGAVVHLLHLALSDKSHDYDSHSSQEREELIQNHRQQAMRYLDQLEPRLADSGVKYEKIVLVEKDHPAHHIINYASQIQAGALALATHAHGPVQQVFMGSVAQEVMQQSHLPVLMVHTFKN